MPFSMISFEGGGMREGYGVERMRERFIVVVALLFLASAGCALGGQGSSEGRGGEIIGGEPAPPELYPWMAGLVNFNYGFTCGGTLIAPDWVLSAAHCVEGAQSADFAVFLGKSRLSTVTAADLVSVQSVYIHPNYNPANNDYDIALLRLATPSTATPLTNFVTPATSAALTPVGASATVIGWGTTEFGNLSDLLLRVQVPIVDPQVCNASYAAYGGVSERMLCAGLAEGGKDSCQGDSGGPLIVADATGALTLAGIVSWGIGCAQPNFYGVYGRVSELVDWKDSCIANPSACTTALP